jgi:hypothetical protein
LVEIEQADCCADTLALPANKAAAMLMMKNVVDRTNLRRRIVHSPLPDCRPVANGNRSAKAAGDRLFASFSLVQ